MAALDRTAPPSVETRGETPERIAGAFRWSGGGGGAALAFLGRGAPPRDAPFPAALLPPGGEPAWLRQVHSARVVAARPGDCGAADALLVERRGLVAIVAVADCVPVVLAGGGALAAVHAGWRGVAAGVVAAAAGALARRGGGIDWAWIGPAIGPCCYEVGEEVAAAVATASEAAVVTAGPRGRPHVDLAAAVAAQLAAAGARRIVRLAHCTRCRGEWLESHRRDGERAGRNLALAWLDGGG